MTEFESLLNSLSPDREAAGIAYEELRRRLVKFFCWEGCIHAEEWADTVLNRIGQKLTAGEHIANIVAFASAVARLVLKEALRQQNRSEPFTGDIAKQEQEPPDDKLQYCLDHCLKELSSDTRNLILQYYNGDSAQRIRNRQQMASQLGISLNSLRNRALRVRDRLTDCMKKCVNRDTSPVSITNKREGAS